MKIQFTEDMLVVSREENDKKYYGIRNAKGESNLLYAIQQKLKALGYKVIKKRMWRDGHMVDELQQYLRTPKGIEPSWMAFNPEWQVVGLEYDWNTAGRVELVLCRDIWNRRGENLQ